MSVVTSSNRYTTRRAAPDDAPEPDIYQFRLIEILDYVKGEYNGKPTEQFVLNFEMLDHQNKDGEPYILRAYFSPIIHYFPNPQKPHRAPDLYLMLKAINGGVPWDLEYLRKDTKGNFDPDGEIDYDPTDVEAILSGIIERGDGVFRASTEQNDAGWARMKKDSVLPLRQKKAATARVLAKPMVEPVIDDDDDGDADFE
jgi:hypothetical protein